MTRKKKKKKDRMIPGRSHGPLGGGGGGRRCLSPVLLEINSSRERERDMYVSIDLYNL